MASVPKRDRHEQLRPMHNLNFSLNTVFNEVLARRQNEGALSKDAYMELVDEILEEHRTDGELSDDFEFKQAREALEARWEEVAESDAALSAGMEGEEEETS